MQNSTRRWIILASPILVVLIGNLAAHFFTALLGQWAWTGTSVVYWGILLIIMVLLNEKKRIKTWFGKTQGSRLWILLAIVIGLIPFPLILMPNIHVMNSIPLVAAWLLFAIINSVCEETYWRGFLLDETRHLPRIFGVIYSTILFTSIHPLMLGVYSKIQAFDPHKPLALLPFGIILLIISVSYCLIYLKTKSLRLAIFSHFLSDLGNLSIFLFMNMVSAG